MRPAPSASRLPRLSSLADPALTSDELPSRGSVALLDEALQQADIRPLPRHIGIMMDGNGRWARLRNRPRLFGHSAGTENVRRVLKACARFNVRVVTLYVFSTENWGRPQDEIVGFFRILSEVIDREVERFQAEGVQLRHLGSLEGVPEHLARKVRWAVEATRHNRDYILGVAFNYGGRADILHAARSILRDGLPLEQVNEEVFESYLSTAGLPDMDLVIRTGGELRLSNFFPWQAAHSLFYSTPVLWPDFDEAELRKALLFYAGQQARADEESALSGDNGINWTIASAGGPEPL